MSDANETHRSGLSAADYGKLTGFDGDWRDTWWDEDFLTMMARTWRLGAVHDALDVGCGVGHWGQRLLPHMDPSATLVGVDAEQTWVTGAEARATDRGLGDRCSYRVASAQRLPWPDDSFDFVTCQTLLMHVPEPLDVVREMVRVLRPGGLFLAAEPNNFGTAAGALAALPLRPWSEVADLLELDHTCARGKALLGEGWYSVGERIPGCLLACGMTDLAVHQNSQCASRLPPYDDLGARTGIQFLRDTYDSGAACVLGGTREAVRRFFLAGGGDESRFAALWTRARERDAALLAAIDAGTWVTAGGHLHYLVQGRKPAGLASGVL